MVSRRSFLLSLGGLVTTAFVARVKRHIVETQTPLLLKPSRPEETLYVYDCLVDGDSCFKWRVTLGPDVWPAPPPPTWREYLEQNGFQLASPADRDRI